MLNRSLLNPTTNSPLLGSSMLKPIGKKRRKSLATALVLTSLVDVFTIMILYLLVAGSGTESQIILKGDEKNLPIATQDVAVNAGTVITIDGDKYFVDGKETRLSNVAEVLRQIKVNFVPSEIQPQASLVIQANKQVDFSKLTPIIRAGSISGFNKFKFAVIHEEG